jgi:hypothetical protein
LTVKLKDMSHHQKTMAENTTDVCSSMKWEYKIYDMHY